jgi:hypothetical protein
MLNLPPTRSVARRFIFPLGLALAGLFISFCLLSFRSAPLYASLHTTIFTTGSTRPLKLAYLILVHTPDSVRASQRLMTAIWRPDFYYLYVVDRDMNDQGRQALAEYLASPDAAEFHARGNVRVMQANVRAGWGSMGLVQNELDGLAGLVRTHDDWDYALAVSGDTYPLVSQERLVKRLTYWRRRGANFVCSDGKKPKRNKHVQAHKSARLAKVVWPTGVTEPDQFGSHVRNFVFLFHLFVASEFF